MRKSSVLLIAAISLSILGTSLNAQTTTGLQLWLKPEGLTNTVNLSKVSYWTNSIGTGNDATNGIVVNQPTYAANSLGGYPVVRFTDNGSNIANNTNLNWLVSPLPLSGNSNSFTAVIVFESQITGSRDTLIQQLGNGTSIFYVQTNAVEGLNPNITSFASSKELPSPYAYPVANWTILTMVQDAVAGTVTLYQNGFALTNTTIGTVNTLANAGWLLGCNKNKSTHGLNGDIAEVLLYDGALNSTDRGTTENYLANKYGFVVLTDNYNTADTLDLSQDIATRQSGSAATANYFTTGFAADSLSITNNQLKLKIDSGFSGFRTVEFAPQVNFITNESGNFKLSYDITSLTQVGDCWAGIVIRSAPQGIDLPQPIWGDGFNTIIRSNGGYVVFPYGFNGGVGWAGGNLAATNILPYHIELIANNNVVTYFVNSELLGSWTLPCGSANYVTLSLGSDNNNNSATFDNFSFTATPKAPELLPTLPGTLKLQDTFNTADNADINSNLSARQTGSAANITWSTAGSTNSVLSIANNTLSMTNTPGFPGPGPLAYGEASPNVDFRQLEHLNSFRMRFTVTGGNTSIPNDTWVGARWRDTRGGRTVDAANGGGTAINLFTGDGRWFLFQSVLGPTNVITFPVSGVVPVAASYEFDIEVRTNAMRMKINGQPLLLDCTGGPYMLPASQVANFVTLQSHGQPTATGAYATFDDFIFESLDPGFTIPAPTILNPAASTNSFRLSVNSTNNIFYAV
ncbi:MAG: LamG-like jellyroll fold domain-containing protein, partial [Verrucomicrobiota bacterium]